MRFRCVNGAGAGFSSPASIDGAARATLVVNSPIEKNAENADASQQVADGSLEIPIARTYRLDQVRDAYRELAQRHTHGKIVLLP